MYIILKGNAPKQTLHDRLHLCVSRRAVSGGAISIDSSGPTGLVFVTMTECRFTRNTAYQGMLTAGPGLADLQGAGGALRLFVAALWLNNTSFVNNSAASAGGAILIGQTCLQVSDLQTHPEVLFLRCLFS